MKERLTIEDIARIAGVSRGTISRVLNNKSDVNAETRKRVKEIIAKFNYSPSNIATALATGRSNIIGLIVTDINNPFFSLLSKGAMNAALKTGYNIFFGYSENTPEKEILIAENFLKHKIDGLIISPTNIAENYEFYRELSNSIPIAFLENVNFDNTDIIHGDDDLGVKLMIDYISNKQYKNLYYIGLNNKKSSNRFDLIKKHGEQTNIKIEKLFDIEPNILFGNIIKICGDRIRQFGKKSSDTIFVAFDDFLAIAFLKAAYILGVSVPDDFSIMGFDNITYSEITYPPLSTVNIPKFEIGYNAVYKLVERLRNTEMPAREIILEPTLIIRSTTL